METLNIEDLPHRGQETLSESIHFLSLGWDDQWALDHWDRITSNPRNIKILNYCVKEGLVDSERAKEFATNDYSFLEEFLDLLEDPNVFINFQLLVHFEIVTAENFDRNFLLSCCGGGNELGKYLQMSEKRRRFLLSVGLFSGDLLKNQDILFNLSYCTDRELERYGKLGLLRMTPSPKKGYMRELMFSNDAKLELLKQLGVLETQEDPDSPTGFRITAVNSEIIEIQGDPLQMVFWMKGSGLEYAAEHGWISLPLKNSPDLVKRLEFLLQVGNISILKYFTQKGWFSLENAFRLREQNEFFMDMIKSKHPQALCESLKIYSANHRNCNPLESEHTEGFMKWYAEGVLTDEPGVGEGERLGNVQLAHKAQTPALWNMPERHDHHPHPTELLEQMPNQFRLVLYFRPQLESFEGQYLAFLAQQYIQTGRSRLFTELIITSRSRNVYPKTVHSLGIGNDQYRFESGDQFQDLCHVGAVPVHFSHGTPQNRKHDAVSIVVNDILNDPEKIGSDECDPDRIVHLPLGYRTEPTGVAEPDQEQKDPDGDYDRMEKISRVFLQALREAEERVLALAA